MHTELELSTPIAVGVVNKQLQLEAVLTAEWYLVSNGDYLHSPAGDDVGFFTYLLI